MIVVGVALAVLAGLSLGGLKLLSERLNDALQKADLLDSGARSGNGELHGPLNYLLIGSDQRDANPTMGHRADSIVIVNIPAGLDRAYLISIPRDLRVAIPPWPASNYKGGQDKINAAFQYGGADGAKLLSATVTNLTGVRFDGAAIVDFTGFKRVVDLLGGVDVCVDRQVTSIHTGHVFPVGCYRMDGAKSLDYARQRYGLPRGDYDRQRHQQQILKGIAKKLTDPTVLANPIKLDQTVRAIGATMTVDTNGVPLNDLVISFRNMRAENVYGIRIPSTGARIDGTSYNVLTPDADLLFKAVREGDVAAWAAANPKWVLSI
uniref:LCP family protein n=1 Tax=Asanoa siamensis TaxID=926357 RepID=UPI00357141FA